MSKALLVVTAVQVEGSSKAEVARTYGVSRRWVHELVRRFDAEGEAGLQPRSRRPHSNPDRTPEAVEERVIRLRKHLSDQGLDAGAHTIAYHLEKAGTAPPAVSTIWRILARRGFVTPQPQKRPKSSFVRFEADLPNERWQADITHVQMAGMSVEILNVIDDHSRFLLASETRRTFKAADVVTIFRGAAAAHGQPASMLTDNGAVFTAGPRGGGRCAIEIELAALGISFRHSTPYHPQTCGKVERFHQTLKRWLAKQPAAGTFEQLTTQLDRFRDYYNHIRPHRALERKTPAEAFAARPKATPSLPVLKIPSHYRVRSDGVDNKGRITLRHNSRLHHIGMGVDLAGTRVTMLVADLHVRIVSERGELLRDFTLDPTRDYQPMEKPQRGRMSRDM